MLRRYLLLVVAVCLGLALSGCLGMKRDPETKLPANAPASWEGQTIGVPVG